MQNKFVESFNGRLRDELLNETLFKSLTQARVTLEDWRHDYNTVRPHSRIGWLTPAVHAAQFPPQGAKPLRIESSAACPLATVVQMEKINRQSLVAAG